MNRSYGTFTIDPVNANNTARYQSGDTGIYVNPSERLVVDGEALEGVTEECKVFVRSRIIRSHWLIGHCCKLFRREVRGVSHGTEVRNKWRIDIPNDIPVHSIEERMVLDTRDFQALVLRGD